MVWNLLRACRCIHAYFLLRFASPFTSESQFIKSIVNFKWKMGKKRIKSRKYQDTHKEQQTISELGTAGTSVDEQDGRKKNQQEDLAKEKKVTEKDEVNHVKRDETTTENIFPHWLPWILFPLTLSLRIRYVLEPTNWWILHPDEIFQTVEVAHSEAFGYGFRPYEYLPPPGSDVLNSSKLSAAYGQEIQLGMYSLRSFILPKVLSFVMLSAHAFGINTSPYLITRIFHVSVTSFLPIAVFQFSRRLHRSRNIGCVSAILVCSSLSLNVLGTHTFINSFLSPFLFLSLVPLLELIDNSHNVDTKTDEPLIASGRDGSATKECQSYKFNDVLTNGHTYIYSKECDEFKDIRNESTNNTFSGHDENANIILPQEKLSNIHCGLQNGKVLSDVPVTCRNDQGLQTNVCSLSPRCKLLDSLRLNEIVGGLVLAICIYIRADLILITLLVVLCFSKQMFNNLSKLPKSLSIYLLGFVTGILIGGYCDYFTYGQWFLAPYQWFRFNVWNSFAGGIFGSNKSSFYIFQLYQKEPLAILSFIFIVVDIVICIGKSAVLQSTHSSKNQSSAIFILLLLIFSSNRHKEFRFIHNVIIFLYIAVARAIVSLHNTVKILVRNQNICQYSFYCVHIFIVLFASSHFNNFLNMNVMDRANWTYARNIDSYETNICLDFIRQRSDVKGVFMDRSLHMSGVYSVLRHDVPIFALNIFEYMEYRQKTHLDVGSKRTLEAEKKKGFSTLTDISDFISVRNSHYLVHSLMTNPEYNYLILKTSRDFANIGYQEVFRFGQSKVLKRKQGQQTETELQTAASKIQMNWNATILEYEGDRLKHFGVFTKAEERLIMANRVDPKRIGVFRILLDMYRKLNVGNSYKNVLEACKQLYKNSECLIPYTPLVIHHGYHRK